MFKPMQFSTNWQESIFGNAYRRPHRYELLTEPQQDETWKRTDGDGRPWDMNKR